MRRCELSRRQLYEDCCFLSLFVLFSLVEFVAVASILAGRSDAGSVNDRGTLARFNNPTSVAVDTSGTVYVADTDNNLIRMISTASVAVQTLAGQVTPGSSDGQGAAALFNNPSGVAVDLSGTVFVADSNNHIIRAINSSTGMVQTLAGSGISGYQNGQGTMANFAFPRAVAVDLSGTLYVADTSNVIRAIVVSTGVVRTVAGCPIPCMTTSSIARDGQGTLASFNDPLGVAVDVWGNVYVADYGYNLIRAINTSGFVRTLAGSSVIGSNNGPGRNATFNSPFGLSVDTRGTVFVADSSTAGLGNNLVRAINVTTTGMDQTP